MSCTCGTLMYVNVLFRDARACSKHKDNTRLVNCHGRNTLYNLSTATADTQHTTTGLVSADKQHTIQAENTSIQNYTRGHLQHRIYWDNTFAMWRKQENIPSWSQYHQRQSDSHGACSFDWTRAVGINIHKVCYTQRRRVHNTRVCN